MLEREIFIPENIQLHGIQDTEDFMIMKTHMILLKLSNFQLFQMLEREIFIPENIQLHGIQDTEDSMIMKMLTISLNFQTLELLIMNKNMNNTDGIQGIEDITIMRVNMIILKHLNQIPSLLFQTLELEISDLTTHLTIGIQVIESITISKVNMIMLKLVKLEDSDIYIKTNLV